MWNAVFWVIFPLKIKTGGVYETGSYFTNWTFGVTGAYFTLQLFANIDCSGIAQQYIYLTLFWTVLGQNMIVFFLVYYLMVENYSLMENMIKEKGGNYTLGEIVDLEKVFHVLPTFFLLYLYALDVRSIRKSLGIMRRLMDSNRKWIAWFSVIFQISGGIFLLIFFEIILGFSKIYGVSIGWEYGFLMSVGVLIFFVSPLYYNAFPSKYYLQKNPKSFINFV